MEPNTFVSDSLIPPLAKNSSRCWGVSAWLAATAR
jgi:hypothetical protein